ncbi:MAG TPA: class I SAM-dependent methyltransferase, partial [Flavisolibacter sp.]|jgi:ubiquinone/menaquinone biosynthesis C-methylase UbiE|nr:class I SAM-dependent methyltransferase [Flavisolibacter sp.]
MAQVKKEEIKNFWNQNPVGENFVEYGDGGAAFFKRYDEFRYKTEGHILGELDKIDFKNKDLLEIGIGQAADSEQIVKRGANYYGIDLTETSIQRIKDRFKLYNLPYKEVQIANAEKIPYQDNFFDIVYSHGVIHHSPNIEKIVDEIHRVLKPGGQAVIMLYHKSSFNYHVSISIFRRVGLSLLMVFPFLSRIIQKITGEDVERINEHRKNIRKDGFSYLKMKNFIHRSTDGPLNIYSSVWTAQTAGMLFKKFNRIETSVHFLNERHLLGMQHLISKKLKQKLADKYGWHLWIKAEK